MKLTNRFLRVISLLAFLFLLSCGQREQNLADAKAGARALQNENVSADPSKVKVIAKGVENHVDAAAEGKQLPPPRMSEEQIAVDPEIYREQGARAVKDSLKKWTAIVGGVLLFAFGITKALPGTAGWASTLVYNLLANRADRQARAREETLRDGFATLVRVAEQAPPEVAGPVKRFVADKVMPKVPLLGPVIEIVKSQAKPTRPLVP